MADRDTQYGFVFGPIEVQRSSHDPERGYCITIKVGDRWFDFYTSPKGKNVSIHERLVKNHRVVSSTEIIDGHRRQPR